MKKNRDANNRPVFMFIIAIFFIAAGFLLLLVPFTDSETGEAMSQGVKIALITVFWVVGIIIFVFAIYRTIMLSKYKKLLSDTTAYVTTAHYISAHFSGADETSVVGLPVSANVYSKIKYSYKDEKGVEQIVKSIYSYTPNQVAALLNKKEFKIKCRGKLSAIIEELPDANKHFNV